MTTIYNIDSVTKGVNGFGLPFCDTIFSATLVAAADTTIAVPLTMGQGMPAANQKNKFIAVIVVGVRDSTHDTYIAVNATAAVPAGGAFAATTSEVIPNNQLYAKYCKAGDTIHLLSSGTPDVSVAFYAILD